MAHPTPRRKAATELEARISAGHRVDPRDVVAAVDQPMHNELVRTFRSALSADERESLACDVIVELLEHPTRYDVWRNFETFRRDRGITVRTVLLVGLRCQSLIPRKV